MDLVIPQLFRTRELRPARVAATLAAALASAPASAIDRQSFENRFQLESTVDATSLHTLSADVTATFSPLANYWESGPRVRLTGAAARYRYWGDPEKSFHVTGLDRSVEILGGYSFITDRGAITLLGGPEAVWSEQKPSTPFLPDTEETKFGAKLHGSILVKPTDLTMAYMQGQYSTISNSYLVQGKLGIAIAKNLFIGPEAAVSGLMIGDPASQFRLGAHLTGIDLGFMQVGVSGGLVEHRDLGTGAYASSSIHILF